MPAKLRLWVSSWYILCGMQRDVMENFKFNALISAAYIVFGIITEFTKGLEDG